MKKRYIHPAVFNFSSNQIVLPALAQLFIFMETRVDDLLIALTSYKLRVTGQSFLSEIYLSIELHIGLICGGSSHMVTLLNNRRLNIVAFKGVYQVLGRGVNRSALFALFT